ncbi:MAG: glutathione S-transferase family protein [Gammaproteobacteria bacterium]|nr:glutathione S-transferase family protein [Gammaproteobacteria bacterium]
MAKIHPDKERGKFLARAVQRQITEAELQRANNAIIAAIDDMERRLQDASIAFLFANHYTMADSVATARLFRLQRLNFPLGDYPLTCAYYEKIQQRPSFNTANLVPKPQ